MFKPILFNTEMVKAIIDGRKTQTRRLVKESALHAPYFELCAGTLYACDMYGEWHPAERFCRIQPGDILWVRETWYDMTDNNGDVLYRYRADLLPPDNPADWLWKPSIHMPKEAARIFLRVKDVRLERLQDCGNGWCVDIEKEGVRTPQNPLLYVNDDKFHDALRAEMKKLWDSTIKPADLDEYGWNADPWVWVIEFERIKKPEDWV